MSIRERLGALVSSPRAPEYAALLGALLSLPTLAQGKLMDDHMIHAGVRRGDPWWSFINTEVWGTVAEAREGMRLGWWAADEFRVHFMRPLSALSHTLDFTLWPEAPWLMHLENLVLYALLILVVGRVFQRLLGPGPAAGLACLVFAIDEIHAASVCWISARNTILAALLATLAFAAHLRWRDAKSEGGAKRWPYAIGGSLCFILALLASEGGLAAFGYILAWSLICERTWRERLTPLVPYVAIIVVWRVAYVWLGHGLTGSDIYTDPGTEPLVFIQDALVRVPAMACVVLSLPAADALTAVPGIIFAFALGLIPLAWALAPLASSREAQALGLGTLAAAVPFAAAAPASRTMLLLGLGGAALFAMAWTRRREPVFQKRGRRGLLVFMAVCQLGLAPLIFVPLSLSSGLLESDHRQLEAAVPEAANETLVVLNLAGELSALYPQDIRENAGGRWPAHAYVLYAGVDPLTVERLDTHTLALSTAAGWGAHAINRMSRPWSRSGFAVGDTIELERGTVEIKQVNDEHRPVEIEVRFDDSIDELVILGFEGREVREYELAVGEPITIQAGF